MRQPKPGDKQQSLNQRMLGYHPVMSEGLEMQWIPGGYTSGGIAEVIIDPPSVGEYTVNPIG